MSRLSMEYSIDGWAADGAANSHCTSPLPSMPSWRAAAGVRSMPARLVLLPSWATPDSACGRAPVCQ